MLSTKYCDITKIKHIYKGFFKEKQDKKIKQEEVTTWNFPMQSGLGGEKWEKREFKVRLKRQRKSG